MDVTGKEVELTEMYEEKYPSGKRNYEMVAFGPVIEKRTVIIPNDCQDPDEYLEKIHMAIHDRLVRVVRAQVNQAIESGRLVGVKTK